MEIVIGERTLVLAAGDETARLVAADAMQEAGRSIEEARLRDLARPVTVIGNRVFPAQVVGADRVLMANANHLFDLLARLGFPVGVGGPDGVIGVTVSAAPFRNTVRVAWGNRAWNGALSELDARLCAANPGGTSPEDLFAILEG